MAWPVEPSELEALQRRLADERPPAWSPPAATIGGCFVCFTRGGGGPGSVGEPGWSAAVTVRAGSLEVTGETVISGTAPDRYRPGLLALREGPLLAAAVAALGHRPEVLVVNATGRDHPRRAGLAVQLGWALDVPTVGVTDRPLAAAGDPPPPGMAGSSSPLRIDAEQVGWWLRTRHRAKPLAVSPGWRTDLASAVEVVMAAAGRFRTPEPLRQARRLARTARSTPVR